jgi:hypothetical protein
LNIGHPPLCAALFPIIADQATFFNHKMWFLRAAFLLRKQFFAGTGKCGMLKT